MEKRGRTDFWFRRKKANEVEVESSEEDEHVAFPVVRCDAKEITHKARIKLYIDSAAADHLINNFEMYSSIRNLENPLKIYVVKSKEYLIVTKIASICVILKDCKKQKLLLFKMLFDENVRYIFLSIQCLVKRGLKVNFDGDKTISEKYCVLLACGHKQNRYIPHLIVFKDIYSDLVCLQQ